MEMLAEIILESRAVAESLPEGECRPHAELTWRYYAVSDRLRKVQGLAGHQSDDREPVIPDTVAMWAWYAMGQPSHQEWHTRWAL
jgi:hypothetical protein